MMKVINKIGDNNAVEFRKLAVGSAYYDEDGFLCIKTSDPDWDETSYGKCIAYIDYAWREEEEHEESKCIPLKTEIVVLGYNEVSNEKCLSYL